MGPLVDFLKGGKYWLEIRYKKGKGCYVIFSVNDPLNRRIIKAPVLHQGKVKHYSSSLEAVRDSEKRLFQKFNVQGLQNFSVRKFPKLQWLTFDKIRTFVFRFGHLSHDDFSNNSSFPGAKIPQIQNAKPTHL